MIKAEYKTYMIEIDQDTCVGCGSCVNVCGMNALDMGEKGPVYAHPENCIGCTHCTAVCPTRAMHAVKRAKAPADQPAPVPTEDYGDKKPFVSFEDISRHVAARRSVRNFTDEVPSRELLNSVLQAARYAPTACNFRNVKFGMISDPEHIKTLREMCMKMYPMPRVLLPAPCLMLVLTPKVCPEDAAIAATTVDLVARSAGLGCTFAGLVRRCIEQSEEVRKYVRDVCGVKYVDEYAITPMYLGFPGPEANFLRPAVRDPPEIFWA